MSTTDSAVEQDLDRTLAAAASAAPEWARRTPAERADALTAVADALDAASPALVPIAIAETGLAEGRLTGEVTRTTVQLLSLIHI